MTAHRGNLYQNAIMPQNATIQFSELLEALAPRGNERRELVLTHRDDPSFSFLVPDKRKPYIEPALQTQQTSVGFTAINDARVILISAPAATGKSMMTKQLSARLNIPCFDLAKNEPVGKDSLIGKIYRSLQPVDMAWYIGALHSGNASMLIDALDEGYIATGQGAFDSFLNDIAQMAKGAAGIPFIILGRTAILEYATLFFEEAGVPVTWLQIQPFDRSKALEFIFTSFGAKGIPSADDPVRVVVDHIFDSLGSCFAESDEATSAIDRFLGYAPVLESIVSLLKDNQNPKSLLQELSTDRKHKIDLLIDIVRRILEREQTKFIDAFSHSLEPSLKQYVGKHRDNLYSTGDQIARILHKAVGQAANFSPTGDDAFDRAYNQYAEEWLGQHPFLSNGKMVNPVFEGYVLARLANREEYTALADLYMRHSGPSFLFYEFFTHSHNPEGTINPGIARYLIAAYQANDTPATRSSVSIIADYESNTAECAVRCAMELSRPSGDDSATFIFDMEEDEMLPLGRNLSNITVDAPIGVTLGEVRTEFCPPVDIDVDHLSITSRELVFSPGLNNKSAEITLESPQIEARLESGIQQCVVRSNVKIRVITDSTLFYPLVQYRLAGENADRESDLNIHDLWSKFRRIILHFRANGNGELGKCKAKIDNRIGVKPSGKAVLDALLRDKIITASGNMYYLDSDKLAERLGVSFSSLRDTEMNNRVREFLSSLDA